MIFLTDPMFSGVYGKIDHSLNGTDHRALKKAHGTGAARIGGQWRIAEESVLNFLSALSISTTITQLFQTSEVIV
jgi:hypothetical protein